MIQYGWLIATLTNEAWKDLLTNSPLIIASLATLVTSVAGLVNSFRNTRKIDDLHSKVNGRMDQMLDTAKKEGQREGFEAGQQSK